ncbi:MAG: hypothetical protein JW860_14535 [Sedimentisphaerales bacterium]|nr:hypothetical protein [Sedimentisphaerales bacterium]
MKSKDKQARPSEEGQWVECVHHLTLRPADPVQARRYSSIAVTRRSRWWWDGTSDFRTAFQEHLKEYTDSITKKEETQEE